MKMDPQEHYTPLPPSLVHMRADADEASSPTKRRRCADEPLAVKVRKIRVFPTSKEADTLRRWFGTARWTYNQCLTAVNGGTLRTKKALRAQCLNAINFKETQPWVLETPYDIRDEAMCDLLKAYDTNFAAGRAHFTIKYRCKKAADSSIVIHSKHWLHKHGAYAFLRYMRSSEPLPGHLGHDSRLVHTRYGKYYICIPVPLDTMGDSQAHCAQSRIIALDPGVRTFMTAYDPAGATFEWGQKDLARIYRLCHAADDLQSRWTHIKNRKMCIFPVPKGRTNSEHRHRLIYRFQRAAARIHTKIRALVDDLHRRLAKWLITHYELVLLPEFQSSHMLRKGQRRIRSKTARGMATWSHYRFRQHILHKVREHPGCRIALVNEAYTSKTCGACGHIHRHLGGSKLFKCPQCGLTADRDIHAARNILLRWLTTSGVSPPRVEA